MGREIRQVSSPNNDKKEWYQVFETVSENGSPVTPPFETKKELEEYLINQGTSADDSWDPEAAKQFVKAGFAFSARFGPKLKTVAFPHQKEYWNTGGEE